MKLEAIKLKNFRSFQDVEMKEMPRFCVIVGANGTGKSTLFSVFDFLKTALEQNVYVALTRLGGSKGFSEVRSRGQTGPIEIEIKFRVSDESQLITYGLVIDEENGAPVVLSEILKYRRGNRGGAPWRFIDFSRGKGMAVVNEPEKVRAESELKREEQTLRSSDTLAVKGLAQFQKFPAALALGDLISNWYISDFHIQKARPEQEIGTAEHLSREGENLALVTEFLYKRHRVVFDEIIEKLKHRVPGITKVDAKETDEGRILLRFQDGAFTDPFLARYVSDGTLKMFAYLVMLHDPNPHPLVCVEEPENQLYPRLLEELAEEFRSYSTRKNGGQVFVSTHSPDFLNAARLDEVFWLVKKDGYTSIQRAQDNEQIRIYMEDGSKMGYLWNEGFFEGVDPQ